LTLLKEGNDLFIKSSRGDILFDITQNIQVLYYIKKEYKKEQFRLWLKEQFRLWLNAYNVYIKQNILFKYRLIKPTLNCS
jgi:hypothetical protein